MNSENVDYSDYPIDDYLACALWASVDKDDDPLDKNYGVYNFTEEAFDKLNKTWLRFIKEAKPYLRNVSVDQVQHDLWLTQNGHGTGFWDRPEVYGKLNASKLTEIADKVGMIDLYVTDDKLVDVC